MDLVTVKFLHVLTGILLFGIILTSYYFSLNNQRIKNQAVLVRLLQFGFVTSAIIFPLIGLQFITGNWLTTLEQIPASTAWIKAAYALLGISLFMSIIILLIHWHNWQLLKKKTIKTLKFRWIYHGCYLSLMISLLLIIHDAVTKRTWL